MNFEISARPYVNDWFKRRFSVFLVHPSAYQSPLYSLNSRENIKVHLQPEFSASVYVININILCLDWLSGASTEREYIHCVSTDTLTFVWYHFQWYVFGYLYDS